MKSYFLFIFICLSPIFVLSASESKRVFSDNPVIYTFNIDKQIGPEMWRRTMKAMDEAHRLQVDLIFISLNTYGGQVDMADSIRTKILNSEIPVYVLIKNNAASAGALISLACDSIYMQPGSTIGAATVVDQSGTPVPDKYQSYMRKKMRATAEEKNRNPEIAEAMVDPDKVVPGVSDSGKVVTLTTKEALEFGFCEAEVKTMSEALKRSGIIAYTETKHRETQLDAVIGFLINPAFSGILILIIIGGIYFELQTPGLGFPIIASIIAAMLYFAPLYLEGLAENWEILLFIGGLILVAVEIFVIPGFGVAGISGIIFIIFGLALSMVGNVGFDFEVVPNQVLVKSFTIVTFATFGSISLSIIIGLRLLKSSLFSQLILKSTLRKDNSYGSLGTNNEKSIESLVGKIALASTALMPSGKVIFEDEIYDASVISGFAEKGEKVKIVRRSVSTLFVQKI